MTSSADVSPTSTPCGTPLSGAPKYGTVIPNRIFVGGIAANTTEQELKQFFSAYGAVKDSKIIADRAGVSKGYGFITFENQEDADRIIKKEVSVESDNLVFRDRKLNIGPAIRKQQVLSRAFESPVSPGTVMFSNGVPYTYQNGMAIFASPEGGYTVPQAQPQTALMVPQTPPMYVQPQYAAYQVPISYASSYQTSPQWATSAAAATAGQWRYMTQSPTQALTAATAAANPYMITMQPELMYAQVPPQAYQPAELADATTVIDGTGVEGSISPAEPNSHPNTTVSEPGHFTTASLAVSGGATLHTAAAKLDTIELDHCSPVSIAIPSLPSTYLPVSSNIGSQVASTTSKLPSISAVNVAPYKKPLATLGRRAYSSPTFLVRNGNKVQCVMVPPKQLAANQMTILTRPTDTRSPPAAGARP